MWVDCGPMETDFPATNLFTGQPIASGNLQPIGRYTIARHANGAPSKAPQEFRANQRMPGSINLSCADGHVELSPLEKLWNYYWHLNWKTPNPRPGL